MPAPFREIQVCPYDGGSGAATWREGYRIVHLENGFSSNLPRGYILAGKQKFLIDLFASHPDERGVRIADGLRFVDMNSIGALWLGPFDFGRYKASPIAERDEMVLLAVENALVAFARHSGADEAPIHDAAAAVRAASYECEYETGLSRSTRNRRIRVHIFIRFEREGISWRAEVRARNGELLEKRSLVKTGSYFDVSVDYRKSTMDGNKFKLFDWTGKHRVTLDLGAHAV